MKNKRTKICEAGLLEFNPYEKNSDNLPNGVFNEKDIINFNI